MPLAAFDPAIGEIGQAVGPPSIEPGSAVHQALMPFFIFNQKAVRRPACFSMVTHDTLPKIALAEMIGGYGIITEVRTRYTMM
jgi:hypothetical protein